MEYSSVMNKGLLLQILEEILSRRQDGITIKVAEKGD